MAEHEKLLLLMGKIATVARQITGGKDLNGFPVSPATLSNVSTHVNQLKALLDEYDMEIIHLSQTNLSKTKESDHV